MIYLLNSASRPRILAMLGKLDLGRPYDLTLEPHVERRTQQANRRLFALHTKAAEVVGCSPQELHEQMLGEFFGWEKRKIGSSVFRVPMQRSHNQNKEVFTRFMTFCEAKYVENLGVWLE